MTRAADPSVALLDRLRHAGRQLGLPPGTLLLLYAQQGFLARLDASEHAEHFILKGGLSLFARYQAAARPTQDLDLASRHLPNTPEAVGRALREVIRLPFPDSLTFDPDALRASPINDNLAYPGVGVKLLATVGRARQPLQLDISFGNVITPAPVTLAFPRILLDDAVRVRVYPLETVVAEKFAALLEINFATTRMKDVYDLYVISEREVFSANVLARALTRSFAARGTPTANVALVLGAAFARDAQLATRWAQYLRRTGLDAPGLFIEVMERVRAFLAPLLLGDERSANWRPGEGGWTSARTDG